MIANFEARVREDFERIVRRALGWKHNYPGAAYSTRLERAVDDLKTAIKAAEEILKEDDQ